MLPAHTLSISQTGTMESNEYWNPRDIPVSKLSYQDCKEKLKEILEESVNLHMRSDVPIGAFLSGGIDSSAIVANMAKLCNGKVNTFTVCHIDKAYDESEYAKIVSSKFKTNHNTFTIGPKDFLSLVPSVLEQYDEPFADSSALPTAIVSKLASSQLKVVLTGDGGDEVIGGYERFKMVMQIDRIGNLLGLKNVRAKSIKELLNNNMSFDHGYLSKINKSLINLLSSNSERYLFFTSYFREHKYKLYGEQARNELLSCKDIELYNKYFDDLNSGSLLKKLLYLDQKTSLVNDILYKVDIASMANSLEVRVPFLDHKLVEFAFSIPDKYMVSGKQGKLILKDILAEQLPREFIYRRKKGFEIPVSSWFRNELKGYINDLLRSSGFLKSPFFNSSYIGKMLDAHQKGIQDFGPHLWILMVLEIWHRKWKVTLS